MLVSSSANEDAAKLDNSDGYCSKESCQELRERVESLEKAVRTIVAVISSYDDTNPNSNTPRNSVGKHQDVTSLIINRSGISIYVNIYIFRYVFFMDEIFKTALMGKMNQDNKNELSLDELLLRLTRENQSVSGI